jgi:fluoroacetyl-CoA thioesterase
MVVTVDAELTRIEGRKLSFSVTAHDGLDTISNGTHDRVVIQKARFLERLERKQS